MASSVWGGRYQLERLFIGREKKHRFGCTPNWLVTYDESCVSRSCAAWPKGSLLTLVSPHIVYDKCRLAAKFARAYVAKTLHTHEKEACIGELRGFTSLRRGLYSCFYWYCWLHRDSTKLKQLLHGKHRWSRVGDETLAWGSRTRGSKPKKKKKEVAVGWLHREKRGCMHFIFLSKLRISLLLINDRNIRFCWVNLEVNSNQNVPW